MNEKEIFKMHANNEKFYCPVLDWECPYCKLDGTCSMIDEGDDPKQQCDDAMYYLYLEDNDEEDE